MRGHVPTLYRYAYRWTRDVDQAEDLVQDALTRLYQEMPQLREIELLRPWAARVMYRIFVDTLRRARRSPVSFVGRSGSTGALLDDEDDEDEAADATWDPVALTEQALQRERIAARVGAPAPAASRGAVAARNRGVQSRRSGHHHRSAAGHGQIPAASRTQASARIVN